MAIARALEFLTKSDILLASGSPRRAELLSKLDIACLSQLSIPESVENLDYRTFPGPKEYVSTNISNKLHHAMSSFPKRISRWKNQASFNPKKYPDLIIVADTVVVYGKEVMEKPKSPEDNARMLKSLSGNTHRVITGVAFSLARPNTVDPIVPELTHEDQSSLLNRRETTFAVETDVSFGTLDDSTISWYVRSGEGADKAGGYAIQGLGAGLIQSVNGCFYNVIGFPLNRFLVELNQALDARPPS